MILRNPNKGEKLDVAGLNEITVLIDRSGYGPNGADCPTIASPSELGELLEGLNQA